ncbi:tryptophan synthase subunit alpha [Geobacter sp. DSM 9736]|uniref:tryptophan synthase subunit alpha n=1 Tax=Geobacter sp. DSM 9736 TaxID=1277350 RepID=UPI000B50708F|nr:tryptophan synthase subunit alpha [Geobacter sp. DSM 9736]SNB44658.1 tryptophan synthase, alpha chain [Geobacter sp. DSM 9736]
MGRLSETFARLKKSGEKALVTFITAGDPDLAVTEKLIPILAEAGADVIELGIPFSDPMADGPTIQKSSERALASGTTLPDILEMVKRVRRHSQVPLVLMGYYNPIFLYGQDRFATDAVAAGVDGVLLVDLPPEEAEVFKAKAKEAGLDTVFLLTPTANAGRIAQVRRFGSGFVYYVSVTGVTGARSSVDASVFERVAEIRGQLKLPVAVGFGISSPEQAAQVAKVADGVVVGSAIVKLFEEFHGDELSSRLAVFVRGLKEGIARTADAPEGRVK